MAENKPQFSYSLDNAVPAIYTNNLITARAFQRDGKANGEPKFGATFCFPEGHADMSPLKQKALAAARAKWPGIETKNVKWPWLPGSTIADRAKIKGKDREVLRPFACVLNARSVFEVALSILDNGNIIDLATAEAKNAARDKYFYDGVLLGAVFNFVPYEQNDTLGITCYLNRVLSLGEGERIKVSSAASGAEVFAKYSGRASHVDPGMNADMDI